MNKIRFNQVRQTIKRFIEAISYDHYDYYGDIVRTQQKQITQLEKKICQLEMPATEQPR